MPMVEQPSGTVTFLFSDIEGSTRLLQELGPDRYREALVEHRRVLREAFDRHGGYEVDYEGDSFFVAFADAGAAVAAAGEAQAALAGGPVRVRMGLHTGEPLLDPPKYVGVDVHRAARIMSAGHGGQVLLSTATHALLEGDLPLRDLGPHRLKDLLEPERLYQLGAGDFPRLKTLYQASLPTQPTPFLGRERELMELLTLCRSEEARLVTLTGPGGTGKTRLALQAAAELADDHPDGAYWVPLQALRDPALVLETISQVLETEQAPAAEIADKHLLLLLDNMEQLLDAATQIAELLSLCPHLKLLVTSREPLHVRAEREYEVHPFVHQEAVGFFSSRARDVKPDFQPDPAVSEICQRLDNLPLALELAAARVRQLSTTDLLERLSTRLPLLTGGYRDLPERQQTLRATIAWSHDLLDPHEQQLFARIGVFAGGCTLTAAEQVADAEPATVESLVDKSLLRHDGDRYTMLETIREYALESLDGEGEKLRTAHAAFFLALAERAEPKLRSPEGSHLLDVLEAERDNLRTALDRFRAQDEIEHELRLAASLDQFWLRRGPIAEGQRRLQEAAARAGSALPEVRAAALEGASYKAFKLGDYEAADALARETLDLARAIGDVRRETIAISNLAHVAEVRHQTGQARALYEDALALARDSGQPRLLAVTLVNLASVALVERDYERAAALCRESLTAGRVVGDPMVLSGALQNRGHAQVKLGDLAGAAASVSEALELALRERNDDQASMELILLAAVAEAAGRADAAARLLGLADTLAEAVGGVLELAERQLRDETEAQLRGVLGDVDFDSEYATGHRLTIEEALAIAREL
jgi:predicted ATPase